MLKKESKYTDAHSWIKDFKQQWSGHADENQVVFPEWLDSRQWLKPFEDNDEHFKKYSLIFWPNMQIWWHSETDHCPKWSTIYVVDEPIVSNPTIRQAEAFYEAFLTLIP